MKKLNSKFVKFLLASFFFTQVSFAAHTVNYQGFVYDEGGNPVTSSLVFRFSVWSDSDFVPGVSISTGGVLTSSGFTGYSEVQEISPDQNGSFATSIGIFNQLPVFDSGVHKFLQVEVKQSGEKDSAFEVLDTDGDLSNSTDRRVLGAAPYAVTAQNLENYKIGFSSGNLVPLGEDGKFQTPLIPNEIEETEFTLNSSNLLSDVKLIFGQTLGKVFKWASDNARFELGDSLFVWGDLSNTGDSTFGSGSGSSVLINGNLTLSGLLNGKTLDSYLNLNSTTSLVFSWDSVPGTESKIKDSKNLNLKNKSFIMTRTGAVVSLGLTTNPTDSESNGTYFVTKNDDGFFSTGKVVTSLSQEKTGTGDSSNSSFTNFPVAGPAGLELFPGDVVRVYHEGSEDLSVSFYLEFSY